MNNQGKSSKWQKIITKKERQKQWNKKNNKKQTKKQLYYDLYDIVNVIYC